MRQWFWDISNWVWKGQFEFELGILRYSNWDSEFEIFQTEFERVYLSLSLEYWNNIIEQGFWDASNWVWNGLFEFKLGILRYSNWDSDFEMLLTEFEMVYLSLSLGYWNNIIEQEFWDISNWVWKGLFEFELGILRYSSWDSDFEMIQTEFERVYLSLSLWYWDTLVEAGILRYFKQS